MEKLPLEITENILLRLPMVSQLQCRELCKTWRKMLPKPKKGLLFGVSHRKGIRSEAEFYFSEEKSDQVVNTTKLDHSFLMPATVYHSFLVGSCNGLVCYAGFTDSQTTTQDETKIYVCNPVTREHTQLPSLILPTLTGAYGPRKTIGFGYIRSRNEYKVVGIHFGYPFRLYKVQVYTLHSGGGCTGWRNISNTTAKGFMSHFNCLPLAGVFTGGVLHWLDRTNRKANIVAFDLEHETFELLPSIPSDDVCDSNVANRFGIMELGGNLCVLLSVQSKHIIIWELRQRKIVKHGPYWRRKFTIAWEDYSWFEPFALTEYDECLLLCSVILSCYDPETRTLRKLEETLKKFKDELVYSTTLATPHVNSLVSLKALSEKRGGKKRKSHEKSEKNNLWLCRSATQR